MTIVPKDGLVLVTGVNGYIGSVIAQTLLKHGYRVRGTVRDPSKNAWMQSYFGSKFELVQVADMNAAGAFGDAVKGVDGILHVAANMSMSETDVSQVEIAAKSMRDLLELAAQEPSVKRVVLTSSQAACIMPVAGVPYEITVNTWNEASLKAAHEPFNPTEDADISTYIGRGMNVYAARKLATEHAGFDFVKEKQPSFTFNSVVPNLNIGTIVSPVNSGYQSSMGLMEMLVRGIAILPKLLAPQWFVDVEDTALLHLGALTLDDVENERLLAFSGPFSWTEAAKIMRKNHPELESVATDIEEPDKDLGVVRNERSIEVLERMGKPGGFTSLEETVEKSTMAILEGYADPSTPKNPIDGILASMTPQ